LLSRCVLVRLTSQGLSRKFAEKAKEIAELEGLCSKGIGAFTDFLAKNRNNMRALLMAVESGEFLYEEERRAAVIEEG